MLAGGIDLAPDVRNGRNFEYYSENIEDRDREGRASSARAVRRQDRPRSMADRAGNLRIALGKSAGDLVSTEDTQLTPRVLAGERNTKEVVMIRRQMIVIASVLLLLTDAGRAQQGTAGRAADPKVNAEQRADALLRQMTIEEKAMQLSSVFPPSLFDTTGTNRSQLDALLKNGIGHVSALGLIGHKTPEELAKPARLIGGAPF